MKRVVITGMGIWSCIGQDLQTVAQNLKEGRSGIIFDAERVKAGLQSGLVGNVPLPDLKPFLPRSIRSTMADDSKYAYMAAKQAFEQARINDVYMEANEVGIIFGADGNSAGVPSIECALQEKDTWCIEPGAFFRMANSTVNMNLAACFHLKGINISVSAACASSSQAIGVASMLIRNGMQTMILVGGAGGIDIVDTAPFDALNSLSVQNNHPEKASRPFDKSRDGAITSGGAAALVLEEYDHAVARGATILAEVIGYGFSGNDAEDIFSPSSDAIYRAIKNALLDAELKIGDIDYINSCASSSITDDVAEAEALSRICQGHPIYISSTESMTGHEGWMGGASEAVYSILMMQNGFVAPNINLENVIDEAKDLNIVRETIYTPINTVLSDSSGLGGTNSALVFRKI